MKQLTFKLLVFFLLFGTVYTVQPANDNAVIVISDVSSKLRLYHESKFEIPDYIEGILSQPVEADSEMETVLKFFESNRATYKMTTPLEEFHFKRLDRDLLGMKHIRLQQYYRGIRVITGDMIAHFNSAGVLITVNGNYYPQINLDIYPDLISDQAVDIVREDLSDLNLSEQPPESELVIFPWEGEYYLCWKISQRTTTPAGRWEYYIEAHHGDIVFNINLIKNVNDVGSGLGVMGISRQTIETNFDGAVYIMIDSTRQLNNNPRGYAGQMPDGNFITTNIAGAALPGSTAADSDNLWDSTFQAAAVDAHVFTGAMYDWWLREFNRNSYDDYGSTLLCIVDYTGEGNNNAYWDGLRIVVWMPSADRRSLAGCPEVIAHEWAHAITEYTSGLVYFKEPGALNESFSDMMGIAFEWAHDSLDTPDWLLGENSFTNGTASRDMAEPHNYNDPDFYGLSDPYWYETENCIPTASNDYCGNHRNNGVGNKWFYLVSVGGTHHDQTVTGLGVENAIKIAYRANAYYWVSSLDFKNAAMGTISAANDLDPSGQWTEQVNKAWKAVGVYTPQPQLLFSYPDGIPSLLNRNEETVFDVIINGIYGGIPVSGSVKLHYSINDRPFTDIVLTEISSNRYEAALPALECDSVIRFYISTEETSLGSISDPDTTKPHTAIPASEVKIVFEDNFENSKGWSVTGDAVLGQWQRSLPSGGGYRSDPLSDFDGSGRCYLTGNGGGDTDVDGGTTNLTSPSFNATDDDYEIYYACWYANDYSHAPYADTMRVLISNDDGQNWVIMEEIGSEMQASGGWFGHTLRISDFITPTENMKIRFEVSDLGDGSVVEAAIDAVSIRAHRCKLFICGDVDNSGGEPDISDITRIISYLYLQGDPPTYPGAANVDGSPDGTIDISDITYLIRFLYMGGSALICDN